MTVKAMINPLRVGGFALIGPGLSILTACGLDGGGSDAFTFSGDRDPPPLEAELEVPASVRAGDTAPLLVRVRNTSILTLDLLSPRPPHEFEIHDSSGELVWSSLLGVEIDPRTGETRLLPGFRVSVAVPFDFDPHEEVVLDAEWDTTTISREDASPGVYFVSAIVSMREPHADHGAFRLKLEPIMITVTGSGGDATRAAEAP